MQGTSVANPTILIFFVVQIPPETSGPSARHKSRKNFTFLRATLHEIFHEDKKNLKLIKEFQVILRGKNILPGWFIPLQRYKH